MTTASKTPTLHEAVSALAAQNQDWAQIQNGVGYNKSDSWLGASLAVLTEAEWTPEMRWTAWNMLRKYAKQLSRYGIEFDQIEKPEKPAHQDEDDSVTRQVARGQVWEQAGAARARSEGKIERSADGFVVTFPYNADTVAKVKTIPGRTFDGRTKAWLIPETDDGLAGLAKFSSDTGIAAADDETQELLDGFLANYVEKPAKRIEADEPGTVAVIFPYNEEVVSGIKAVGAKWNKSRRLWTAELDTAAAALGPFIDNYGFHVDDDVKMQIKVAVVKASDRHEASSAQDAEIDLPLFGAILRPFQKAGVAYMLDTDGAINGDEMGLGKTPQSLTAAETSNAFPMVCVVPNLAKLNWLREIDFWLPERSMTILDGGKREATIKRILLSAEKRAEFAALTNGDDDDLRRRAEYALHWDAERRTNPARTVTVNNLDAELIVVNYDIVGRKPSGRLAAALVDHFKANGMTPQDEEGKVVPFNDAKLFNFLIALKPKALSADESHYIKSPKTMRTLAVKAMAKATRESGGRVWMLTGTPILNRPVELVSQLDAIGKLHHFGGFYGFVKRYCGAFYDGHGLNTSGAANLEELNRRLRETCYVRRNKRDVLTELDAVQRSSIDLPLADPKAYQSVAADVIAWVRDRAGRDADFLAEIADLDESMRKKAISEQKQSAEARAARAEILVRLNALRLVAAEQMLPAAIEWIREWMEENPDEKMIVFAWHQVIQNGLLAAFPDSARIVADDKPAVRTENEHRFQEDPACRLLVASINAAGVSLTLTAARTVAFAELPWRPTDIDQCEGRAYGRLNDAHGINSYYLLGEDTIYGDMAQLLDAKREVVDEATTGKVGTSGKGIVESLVKRLLSLDGLEEAA
jgi:hypothetical protein